MPLCFLTGNPLSYPPSPSALEHQKGAVCWTLCCTHCTPMTVWPIQILPPLSGMLLVCSISDNNKKGYLEEIKSLEISKTKKRIEDFSTKQKRSYKTLKKNPVLTVSGTLVFTLLTFSWFSHINNVVKKSHQCLYHLRYLKDFKKQLLHLQSWVCPDRKHHNLVQEQPSRTDGL